MGEEETMDFSEGKWLPEEHEKCLEGYVLDLLPREISLLMKTRSPKQVSDYIRGHKQQLDTEGKKLLDDDGFLTGKWHPIEIERCYESYAMHEGDYDEMSSYMKTRSSEQIGAYVRRYKGKFADYRKNYNLNEDSEEEMEEDED